MNRKIFTISVIVFAMDQIIKSVLKAILVIGEHYPVIKNFFYITLIHNYGAAWSMFQNQVTFIIIGTVLALVLIYRYMYAFQMNKRNMIAFGLLTGGIVGNLVDRFFNGYVVDFLNFYIFGYDFPVFNIADIGIVTGVALLVYAILRGEDKIEKNNSKTK